MKHIFTLFLFISGAASLHAQSLDQGNQYLYHERYQSAEDAFHQVLKQSPEDASAWYGLTKALILQDKWNEARDTIMLAPAPVQSQPLYKAAYGAILLQDGKRDEAAGYLKQALDDTRWKNADVLAAVAEAHLLSKNGDTEYTVDLLEKAIKRDKRNPHLYTLLGDAYRKMLNGTEAYKAYQKALNANDKHAAAYYQMGKIFVAQNNPKLYVDLFQKAIAADPDYAPAIYELYYYEFNRDPAKAMAYYQDYVAKSDASAEKDYDMIYLLYLNKDYARAADQARQLISAEGSNAKPKLYKLVSYSLAALKDTQQAITYMQSYFSTEADSNKIAKDFTAMAELYEATDDKADSAIVYYEKSLMLEKDSALVYDTYKKLAELSKQSENYEARANWLGKYYTGNDKATNVDLFNWALSWYQAENYVMADSVFGMYTMKYPEQSYGYYWQAKSQALEDSSMEQGLAVPTYQKLIEVMQDDTANANYKKWMIEANGYLAAYEANIEKDYAESINYFKKVLEIDAENEDAKRYISILEKDLANREDK